MKRPLCKTCLQKPRSYGYKKKNKIYYRSQCDSCIRKKNKQKTGYSPKWHTAGYRKKTRCELCGFKAQHKVQLDVLFVDGNLRNVKDSNLKTVCANCQRLGSVRKLGWRVGDLVADD